MSSSDPQAPAETGSTPTSTQEIPVVQPASGATPSQQAPQQLPPHPGATPPAPVQPVEAPVATGPVDFVPAPPGAAAPPPPRPAVPQPPTTPEPVAGPGTAAGPVWPETLEPDRPTEARPSAARTREPRAPRDRAALLGVGLTVLSVALLELGLSMRGGDAESYWEGIPLWSAFATVCGVLALLVFAAFFATGNRLRTGPAWRIAAAGLVGVAVFWLLVVLPVVDTDRGFVLTAALGALGGALWVGPRRRN